jgi:hypothetical protein
MPIGAAAKERARVLGRLKEAVGDTVFRNWFQALRL